MKITPTLFPEWIPSSEGIGQTLPTLFRLEFRKKGMGTGLDSESHPHESVHSQPLGSFHRGGYGPWCSLSLPPTPTPLLLADSLTPPCGPLGEGVLELDMTDGRKEPREETGFAQIPQRDPSGRGGWWGG